MQTKEKRVLLAIPTLKVVVSLSWGVTFSVMATNTSRGSNAIFKENQTLNYYS